MTHPRSATVAAVLVAGLALAGCSGGEDADPAADEPSQAPSESSGGVVAPPDLPRAPELRQAQGAVADVEVGDCATGAGDQSVSGEATNTAERPRDMVITISWTNDTSDVRGRGVAVLEGVPAGETREWSLDAEVADGATRCVPNVLRGALAGD